MSARDRRSSSWLLGLVLVLASGFGDRRAARSAAPPSPSALVGTWTWASGSQFIASCASGPLGQPLDGTSLTISVGEDSDLVLDMGCHCHLPFALGPGSGSSPVGATLVAPTPCELVVAALRGAATVETATLVGTPENLTVSVGSGTIDVPLIGTCPSATIGGQLVKASSATPACGAPEDAVGVLPTTPVSVADCPVGPGREGLRITMHDEDDWDCAGASGHRGEGGWVLPQASKYDAACKPRDPARATVPHTTGLSFCRVDGRMFRPLTVDRTATSEFYAVLKLGEREAPCPNGAIEVVKQIDNEDVVNLNAAVGHLGSNLISNGATNTSILHFCYFRWADSPAETMTAFPELGFPYAVFHDFDGPQPAWVTLKRWLYSRAERNSSNPLGSIPDAPDATAQFNEILVAPTVEGTYFDLARVR